MLAFPDIYDFNDSFEIFRNPGIFLLHRGIDSIPSSEALSYVTME